MTQGKKFSRFLQILVVVAGVLSFVGWYQYQGIDHVGTAVWSALYTTLQTFIFETGFDTLPVPWSLQIAVYLAPLSLAGSLLFGIIGVVRQSALGFYIRLFLNNPIIVAGNSRFCEQLLAGETGDATGTPKVAILPPGENVPLGLLNRKNLYVLHGDPRTHKTWRLAGVRRASSVLLSPDDVSEVHQLNRVIGEVLGGRTEVSVNYALETMEQKEVFSDSKSWFNTSGVSPHTFQLSHLAASVAVERFAPHLFLDIETLETEAPNLVLEGFSTMTKWLILEAAQLYHYPSLKNLQITLFTERIEEAEAFIRTYPGLTHVVDLEVVDKSEAIGGIHHADGVSFPEGRNTPYMIVSIPEDPWRIPERARQWRRFLTLTAHGGDDVPIRFILDETVSNPEIFKSFSEEWASLRFGVFDIGEFIDLEQIIDQKEVIDNIAFAINESYRTRFGGSTWDDLSDREKEFNRRSARHLKIKLHLMGYAISDDTTLPVVPLPDFSADAKRRFAQMEHKRWNSEKYLDGFIPGTFPQDKEGKAYFKNDLRIHQDIRPFDELTDVDIAKDESTFEDLRHILESVLEKKRLVKL